MIAVSRGRDERATPREWLALFGVFLAMWGVLIGIPLAVLAPNGIPGTLLTVVSVIVGGGCVDYLLHHNNPKEPH